MLEGSWLTLKLYHYRATLRSILSLLKGLPGCPDVLVVKERELDCLMKEYKVGVVSKGWIESDARCG
jgi:hypothetical protein